MRAAAHVVRGDQHLDGSAPSGRRRSGTGVRRGMPVAAGLQRSLDAALEAPIMLGPRLAASRLWEAWQALESWEEAADEELGDTLGELLLVLWSVHRLGVSSEGQAALGELLDEEMHPTFGNALLEDLVGVSFALGAAWANQRNGRQPAGVRIR